MNQKSIQLSEQLASVQFDLYAFISCLMRGADAASDVLQEANLEILRHEGRYDASRPFVLWARGVARHCVLRYYETKGRDRLVFNEALMDHLAERVPYAEDNRPTDDLLRLRRCMAKLVPKQRSMLTARYMRGEAVKAIAAREGCSEGAVSVLLYRVRQLLADCLSKERKRAAGEAST